MRDALRVDPVRQTPADRPLHRDPGRLQPGHGRISSLLPGLPRRHRHGPGTRAACSAPPRPGARRRAEHPRSRARRRWRAAAWVRRRARSWRPGRSRPARADDPPGGSARARRRGRRRPRRHRLDAEQQRLGPPVAQREPLAAERRHVAGLGCVGATNAASGNDSASAGASAIRSLPSAPTPCSRTISWRGGPPARGGIRGPDKRAMRRRKTAASILSIAAPATIIAALYRSPVFSLLSMAAP